MKSGVKVKEMVVGTGVEAAKGSTVVVNLRMFLQRGDEVTSNPAEPRIVIDLGKRDCIAGVRYGIEGMRVGGRRQIVISPHLAYGDSGVPGLIPPKAVLRCEIELIEKRVGI
jgi:FKBP-type peptidyl-prolyl cis-trans isomerase